MTPACSSETRSFTAIGNFARLPRDGQSNSPAGAKSPKEIENWEVTHERSQELGHCARQRFPDGQIRVSFLVTAGAASCFATFHHTHFEIGGDYGPGTCVPRFGSRPLGSSCAFDGVS